MKVERRRDESIEQLLRRSLAADPDAPRSDACLDAEALAAWVDGGLDAGTQAMAVEHVSGCARCQALVGAMARAVPEIPARVPWWHVRSRRWLVPLAAGAAAVALWMVVPEQPRGPVVPQRSEPTSAAREPSMPAPTTPLPAPSGSLVTSARPAPDKPRAAPPAAAREAREEAKREGARDQLARDQLARAARADDSTRQQLDAQAGATARERALQSAPAAAPPPAVAPPAAAAPPVAAATPPEAARLTTNSLAESVSVAGQEIASPDPSIRWRLGPGGTVEYTTNGGTTWEPLSTGVSTELTAGSSPSRSVCWLVGRGGVVLLSTGGRRWRRVPFPEAVDLVSVQAIDARTATVTTTDGRTFQTKDGGERWTAP